MTTESIQVEEVYPVPPARIYEVWLDADAHGAFTGAKASIDASVGGKHTAHDDYIWGTFLELEPKKRIVQAWRTTEFPAEAHDSRVEVLLEAIEDGTRVTIVHSNIPEGQGEKYREGWRQFYLEPLKLFLAPSVKKVAVKKQAGRKAARKGTAKTRGAKKKVPKKKSRSKKASTAKKKRAKKK
jgi:activator of HSP90 ATPase